MSSRVYSIIILLLLCHHCPAQSFNYKRDYSLILKHSQTTGDSLEYNKLLPKFLSNDATLTVFQTLSLMIGFTAQPAYKPYADVKIERFIIHLNDSSKYEQAIHACDTFLLTHPLNQAVILEKAYAFHKLKNEDSATYYKQQFAHLMAAMDWSNDGRMPDKAMFALGPDDGINFADKYYHADVGKTGTVLDSDGNYCKSVEMQYKKDGKDKTLVFYFILQHAANTTVKKNTDLNKKL